MKNQDQTEETVSSESVYRGRILNLRVDTVKLPNGRTSTREIVEHRGAVGIVPVDSAKNVYLVASSGRLSQSAINRPALLHEPGRHCAIKPSARGP
jgi:ADP-ribose pyrophosphatase